jgi:hypothetical protein
VKRLLATAAAAAAIVPCGVALAATAQGKLTGGADVATSIGITRIDIAAPIIDGSTNFVHVNNDKSNTCDGDSGMVNVRYGPGNGTLYPVLCAHFDGGSGMSFDYFDAQVDEYVVLRIQDKGQPASNDVAHLGTCYDGNSAMQWVNRGWQSSGMKKDGRSFPTVSLDHGNFAITP